MGTVNVELGARSYPIEIETGLIGSVGGRLSALGFKGPVAVITNPVVERLYCKPLADGLKGAGFKPVVIAMPDGEEHKNLAELSKIYDALIANRLERTSPIVALGGGVVGDVAGFAASTYLRGVPYVQVPTTLLAQVDSSVGGKTAVNHPRGKNLIGTFYQPRAVYIDPGVLSTLDEREVKAGLAEVIKYGVIRDPSFFEFLERLGGSLKPGAPELTEAIERSCRIKADVVGKDETESGLRAILNYGHTFGHAIETLTDYSVYKHGEAVAVGMRMAADFAVGLGMLGRRDAERIAALIKAVGLDAKPRRFGPERFVAAMRLDKKVAGGTIRLVLPEAIGRVVLMPVDEASIAKFIEGYAG